MCRRGGDTKVRWRLTGVGGRFRACGVSGWGFFCRAARSLCLGLSLEVAQGGLVGWSSVVLDNRDAFLMFQGGSMGHGVRTIHGYTMLVGCPGNSFATFLSISTWRRLRVIGWVLDYMRAMMCRGAQGDLLPSGGMPEKTPPYGGGSGPRSPGVERACGIGTLTSHMTFVRPC